MKKYGNKFERAVGDWCCGLFAVVLGVGCLFGFLGTHLVRNSPSQTIEVPEPSNVCVAQSAAQVLPLTLDGFEEALHFPIMFYVGIYGVMINTPGNNKMQTAGEAQLREASLSFQRFVNKLKEADIRSPSPDLLEAECGLWKPVPQDDGQVTWHFKYAYRDKATQLEGVNSGREKALAGFIKFKEWYRSNELVHPWPKLEKQFEMMEEALDFWKRLVVHCSRI